MMDMMSDGLHTVLGQLIECQIAHADLDAWIDQAELAPSSLDESMFRRLKKRRLALRDPITQLHGMIDPKESA